MGEVNCMMQVKFDGKWCPVHIDDYDLVADKVPKAVFGYEIKIHNKVYTGISQEFFAALERERIWSTLQNDAL